MSVIYFLMDWGVVCSNVLVWRHVNKMVNLTPLHIFKNGLYGF